jgi:voltage-gated potassium channel
MKLLGAQLSYLLGQRQTRTNLKALVKYLIFLLAVVLFFAVLFHWIMIEVENQDHSWVTGVYWTLTVMSTLGFGDITFHSDIGRIFSIVVLISGIVLLLIVLPFAFIRFFYAPWLEAQLRSKAPREVPHNTVGHVIICRFDAVARELTKKLRVLNIPYFVVEPDAAKAANLHESGISAVTGEIDNVSTYAALQASHARMVLANADDTTNTNITLTVREQAAEVPIVAVVENTVSIDLLALAGATHVLPLKQRLGEHLANRVTADRTRVHVVGTFRSILIAEAPVHKTPLAGRSVRDTHIRRNTGLNIVGIWRRGRLLPVNPETILNDFDVPMVAGTPEQIAMLENLMISSDVNPNPVLVLGSGNVGYATAAALKRMGVSVHVIERNETLLARISEVADKVFIGDAADINVLTKAGLDQAPSVVVTTNDDATNIYLSVYCRRLNPDLRIVSRITYQRNIEAIHRAGADFVLSYASLGAESVFSILQNRDLVILGEGIDLFPVEAPESLGGKTLGESNIGALTGLNVIAIQQDGDVVVNPPAETVIPPKCELLMLGNTRQREEFNKRFR